MKSGSAFFCACIVSFSSNMVTASSPSFQCKNWVTISVPDSRIDTRSACRKINDETDMQAWFNEVNGVCYSCTMQDVVSTGSTNPSTVRPVGKTESGNPIYRCHNGLVCQNGGTVWGKGGDGASYNAVWYGHGKMGVSTYDITAPYDGARHTFVHILINGKPFPDAAWGVQQNSCRVACD